jgi:hypothetical protein
VEPTGVHEHAGENIAHITDIEPLLNLDWKKGKFRIHGVWVCTENVSQQENHYVDNKQDVIDKWESVGL